MLPLPISPDVFVREVMEPALSILPKHLDSQKARVLLLAICLQESGLMSRWQILNGGGKGPARGLAQFEEGTRASGGGVWGVFRHQASHELVRQICRDRDVGFDPRSIWSRLEHDDIFAVALARLLMWTDSQPLPDVTNVAGGWALYAERCWRPGKPHPEKWAHNHATARQAVGA